MTDSSEENASAAYDDLSYLARSPNRVAVLTALETGPATRAELLDALGFSRMTLDRTIDAFEARHWVARDSVRYEVTPTGELVASAYADLVETLAFAREYGDVVRWLPTDEMDFDVQLLAESSVTRADRTDPLAVMRRVAEQTVDASRVRALSHAIDPGFVAALRDGVTAGRIDAEAVVTGAVVETLLADEEYASDLLELVDAGAAFYRYDGEIPHLLSTFDDAVGFGVEADDGTPLAVVHCDHPDVVGWAEETVDRYRADATRLTKETVAAAAPSGSADPTATAGTTDSDSLSTTATVDTPDE